MNINVSVSATAPTQNESGRVPLPYPPLRQSDIDMITAATGQEFKWPPAHGELFPGVAHDIASARWRAMLENAPWGDLSTKDLQALRAQGVIDSEFLNKASDFLSGKDAGDSRNGRPLTGTSGTAPVVRQGPDGNTQVDGYL